jgi:DeoR family transcriptional regulator, fructose operon transcriptional repressor
MSNKRIDQIKDLLLQHKEVTVNDLSSRYQVSAVSIRKDLDRLERQGFARRFYGGAALVETAERIRISEADFYSDPVRIKMAEQACREIEDGDCIFLGSGRTCCVLARLLGRFQNLTVVTNNITALNDLLHHVTRVYLIGGEVTSTDQLTMFSSWEQSQSFTDHIFVNKAFTSISGLDLKAGLTVDSVISTYVFRHIPTIAHQWVLLAEASKYDRIAIYPVSELRLLHTVISDAIPEKYREYFEQHQVRMITTE